MTVEGESLGKAVLDLEANLGEFLRNMEAGERGAGRMESSLESVARIAELSEKALNRVKLDAAQATESAAIADRIEGSVGRVGRAAAEASRHLEKVKLDASNAAETTASGDVIDHKLNDITRNANEARRALDRLRLAGVNVGGVGGAAGRRNPGAGVGPFGSGFGRIGLLGAAVGAGTLLGPAAGPGAVGLLGAIPTLAAGGVGALGTLALAFQGVGKAIGGDLKAFKGLEASQKQFVLTVRSLDGWLDKLKQTAGANLFPQLTKALHSALSPETVGAITNAVAEFARAIGQAGVAWGKYFGSQEFQSIFGPLMAAGAHNLTRLSSALLSLFDAVGVIGRAAIPFTNWLTVAADKGAKLADSWLHAKDASGGLAHAMDEAQTSLRLVGGLFASIGRAVFALGRALYPVSKIAVKDLTDGFNELSKIIQRNQQTIREIVGGALAALVSTVKTLTPIVGALARALDSVAHAIGGWKVAFEFVIGGILAARFAKLAFAIGKTVLKIRTIGTAAEGSVGKVGLLEAALLRLGGASVLAALGAAAASVAAVLASSGSAPNVSKIPESGKAAAVAELGAGGKIPQNVLRAAAKAGGIDPNTPAGNALKNKTVVDYIYAWAKAHGLIGTAAGGAGAEAAAKAAHGKGALPPQFKEPGTATPYLSYLLKVAEGTKTTTDDRSVLDRIVATLKSRLARAHSLDTKSALQDALNNYVAQLAALSSSPFGADPAFTKNLGPKGKKAAKPPLIPPLAAHAEALASANKSKASVLGNVGQTAKRYLENELADLQVADKAIRAKWQNATGKLRTQLFAALTRVDNQIRTVRKQISNALKKSRLEQLQFAVDQAKLAVLNATEGTAAYDKAVSFEAKMLRAEIAYLDKRRKNTKLSLDERKRALSEELTAERELKSLLGPAAASTAGANEAQFLASFQAIIKGFAPNAQPAPSGGRGDTHLYELVHETRQTNAHLKDLKKTNTFPGSGFAVASAEAAVG